MAWTGSWYEAEVAIDPIGVEAVNESMEQAVTARLDRYRRMGHDLHVAGARYVPLDIEVTVCVKPDYLRGHVKAALLDVFSNRVLPNGALGFFHPDNFTFGQTLYLSPLIALAMQVPGVQWIDAEDAPAKLNRFRRWGEPSHGEYAAGKITFGRLEIARCDTDPSQPEHGQINFIMEGGL